MSLRSERRFISKNNISTGMMVEFTYKKEDSTFGKYTGIIIDPNKNSQMHCILLNDLPDDEIFRIILELTGEIRFTPYERRIGLSNLQSEEFYNRYKTSDVKKQRRYRTFLIDNVSSLRQILTGQLIGLPPDVETKKVTIGNSVIYGVNHSKFVYVNFEDYGTFYSELITKNKKTYFEGTTGHEEPTQLLLNYFIGTAYSSETLEPSSEEFEKLRKELAYDEDLTYLGNKLAGWVNQTIADGQGLNNLLSAWKETGMKPTATIDEVFKKSIGTSTYNLFMNNLTDYGKNGRYSIEVFTATLDKPGFDENWNYTEALEIFNEFGHDQLWPEDQDLPPGPLKESEVSFNTIRRTYVKRMMEKYSGVYFIGEGHIDELKRIS